jgi:hypothetical protein
VLLVSFLLQPEQSEHGYEYSTLKIKVSAL